MKEYELTILVYPGTEAEVEKSIDKVRNLITSSDGSIVSEDNWGKKKIAYRIKNEDFAVYDYFDVMLPATAPLKISNLLNISEDILRYLLVKADLKGRKALEEAKTSESASNDETVKE